MSKEREQIEIEIEKWNRYRGESITIRRVGGYSMDIYPQHPCYELLDTLFPHGGDETIIIKAERVIK